MDYAKLIEELGATVRFEGLPTIHGSEFGIRVLFQNLICNALKFQSDGNEPEILITGEKTGNKAVLSVRDNGIGMDMKYATKGVRPLPPASPAKCLQRQWNRTGSVPSGGGILQWRDLDRIEFRGRYHGSLHHAGRTFVLTIQTSSAWLPTPSPASRLTFPGLMSFTFS